MHAYAVQTQLQTKRATLEFAMDILVWVKHG